MMAPNGCTIAAGARPGQPTLGEANHSRRWGVGHYSQYNPNSRPAVPAPRREPPDPNDFLPLKPVELLILTMLAAGPCHGYAIRQQVLEYTDGRVAIEAGNLYRHIRGLEGDGLVEDVPPRDAPRESDDERRIYYRLTRLGERVLSAEMLRLRALVRLAEDRRIIARSRT
jgi:DNA-binding PadR family transcriptional regulator